MHFSDGYDTYIQRAVKAVALAAAKHQSPTVGVSGDHVTLELLMGVYPQPHPTRTQIHEYHNKFSSFCHTAPQLPISCTTADKLGQGNLQQSS